MPTRQRIEYAESREQVGTFSAAGGIKLFVVDDDQVDCSTWAQPFMSDVTGPRCNGCEMAEWIKVSTSIQSLLCWNSVCVHDLIMDFSLFMVVPLSMWFVAERSSLSEPAAEQFTPWEFNQAP